MNCKLVAYLRVSTKEQGESALGLEAQKAAIAAHVAATGCVLVANYSETESGKNSDRTEALARAKREKATLVIAKMDRLSRDLAFIANLMESNVPFIAADNPNVNRLTIHVLAAVAEQEARSISERTKAALAAAKERGVILGAARPGHPQLTDEARAKGRADFRGIQCRFVASSLSPMLRNAADGDDDTSYASPGTLRTCCTGRYWRSFLCRPLR
jgi:DNA invertase Pin-like site-specific DNA recombinase